MISQLARVSVLCSLLLLLFVTNSQSQQPVKNYTNEWAKVQELIKKNLPQSALAEVKKIYQLAKKEKQDAQIIKALVSIQSLQAETREENEIAAIKEIEAEIKGSTPLAAALLHSLLATYYQSYYEQHRWQLYNRTETTNFKKDDIATWTDDDLHRRITEEYLLSLSDVKMLQRTSLGSFDAIIEKGNVRLLRPTLFDLLAHQALPYFSGEERDIKKPAYAFEMDQAAAFDPAADFIHRRFTTKDSSSLAYRALLIYQQLIALHINDNDAKALVDVDIMRLDFVKSKSTHPEKEQLYFNAINHIAHQYGSAPVANSAWYKLALYYEEKAGSYSPYGDTTHRYDRVKAIEICERLLKNVDVNKLSAKDFSNEPLIDSYNLLLQMRSQHLQFTTEKVNVPDQPFRASVTYKNINRLYLRIIRPDEKLKTELESRNSNDKYWTSIANAPATRTWEQNLPATNDYQNHNTEIKIDALPAGEYLLVAATSNKVDKETIIGARMIYVSSISFVNKDFDFFVLNRETGQPLAKAAVQTWQYKYDYRTSSSIKEKLKHYTTDERGYFKVEKPDSKNNSNNILVDITYNNERFFPADQNIYYYYYDNRVNVVALSSEKELDTKTKTFLFTDRSIYRPGQTVFFKGIAVLTKEFKNSTVRTGYRSKIFLHDANGQVIDSLSVITNEYGSFSGKFVLPQAGLNGQFSINMTEGRGSASFNVEEYKRPKFYVEYENVKGSYRVNDKISVAGIAKAYAGNNIDGAKVSWRVVREPRFVYPWLYRKMWLPPVASMEIAHGEAVTDKDGKFIIGFTAIPDLSIDRKLDPVFDYRVYADVTDINGETRSGEKSISVSYKAVMLKVTLDKKLPVDSFANIVIRTENMNGEFIPSNVTVTIHRLKEEKRLLRNRYWERPDQFTITREEYIKNFPHDEYDNESDPRTWEKSEKVLTKTDSARSNSAFSLTGSKFVPGYYLVEISTVDKNGETVKDERIVELFEEKSNKFNSPEYIWYESADPMKPGQQAILKLGSAADDLFIVQQIEKKLNEDSTSSGYSFLRFSNEKKAFSFGATEADRGGYGVSFLFVKHNRVYQYNQVIVVPWTNKELDIEYSTFRDKTLPGSEEKWKIKLTGKDQEKIAGEMLASMYDASLDQFRYHQWTAPAIWPDFIPNKSWNGETNFSMVRAQIRYLSLDYKTVQKEYDHLAFARVQYEALTRSVSPEGRMVSAAPTIRREMKYATGDTFSFNMTSNVMTQQGEMFVHGNLVKQTDTAPIVTGGENQIRKNFNETAFFLPDLRTDKDGAIEFSFTIPEALTKWKFQALAHTRDLAIGYSSKEIITQKQLMVQPNAPRFLREGDKISFSVKIVNLTEKTLNGQSELQLFDAATKQPVNGLFRLSTNTQPFTISGGQSQAVTYSIEVPSSFASTLTWRIVAKAGSNGESFSDGEENILPVLSNRMLVTETMPLNMRGDGTREFNFTKLLQSANSKTLQHQSLTIEYTANPVWFAVQALPYLNDYPYDCAEQTWNRYYANSLASLIANSSPRIKQIFEKWKTVDTAALLSNLQKNEELKSVLLEETPWVLQAKTESEQKSNIALLFDMVRMNSQLNGSYEKLKKMQSPNGGFVWFTGGPDDRYMTQYIITGIGHLKKLKAVSKGQDEKLKAITDLAIPYLDQKIKNDYAELVKNKVNLSKYTPGSLVIQYLYMRSFFPEYKIPKSAQTVYNYFRQRVQKTWTTNSKYMQGMTALALHRTGDKTTPIAILRSLKETSMNTEELGMYWKDATRGWWWYEAPIERQALLIEAFQEINNDTKTVNELKTWLLKNKQTNNWESTKATAEACYALLLQGSDLLAIDRNVYIRVANITVNSSQEKEAGTGYLKQTIPGKEVTPAMGTIKVTTSPAPGATIVTSSPSWGAVYWQYFEDLDKITPSATPLKLVKKLFIERNGDRGPVLVPVNDGDVLKIGDKIKVRIELRVDREMEYVHMKDMRASSMEPVNVISTYKWQDGLGYYETTKDASTNFFFGRLNKGTYVFEYPLFITHSGNFSNGITTIQCMYAPEFSAHSEGIRVTVQ